MTSTFQCTVSQSTTFSPAASCAELPIGRPRYLSQSCAAPEAGSCVHACAVPLQSICYRGKSATAATSVFSVHRGSVNRWIDQFLLVISQLLYIAQQYITCALLSAGHVCYPSDGDQLSINRNRSPVLVSVLYLNASRRPPVLAIAPHRIK